MLKLVHEAGGDVLSVDWRTDIDEVWKLLGNGVAVQGNLEPAVLFSSIANIETRVSDILSRAEGRAGYIFNLGGGILPETPVENVRRGEDVTVHGDGSQTRSFCYVSDLVEAILRVAECDQSDPINIGNDVEITVRHAAETVIELTGGRSRLTFTDRPINDPERRRPDLSRAREVLGWSPSVAWRDGLRKTIDCFKRHSAQPA